MRSHRIADEVMGSLSLREEGGMDGARDLTIQDLRVTSLARRVRVSLSKRIRSFASPPSPVTDSTMPSPSLPFDPRRSWRAVGVTGEERAHDRGRSGPCRHVERPCSFVIGGDIDARGDRRDELLIAAPE